MTNAEKLIILKQKDLKLKIEKHIMNNKDPLRAKKRQKIKEMIAKIKSGREVTIEEIEGVRNGK